MLRCFVIDISQMCAQTETSFTFHHNLLDTAKPEGVPFFHNLCLISLIQGVADKTNVSSQRELGSSLLSLLANFTEVAYTRKKGKKYIKQ